MHGKSRLRSIEKELRKKGFTKKGARKTAEMATPASRVADYFIHFSHEVGDPLSNLKLQKLLYYAQAWYLALHNRPLFTERIEAWVHGPAVLPVYGQFKEWAWKPIMDDPSVPRFTPQIRGHLHQVMRQYGPLNAYQLELLTHRERPWRDARRGLPPDAPSHAVISHESMRDFYKSRLHGKTQG